MEKVKNEAKRLWGLAVAHPKIAVAVVVVAVAIYFLANQEVVENTSKWITAENKKNETTIL